MSIEQSEEERQYSEAKRFLELCPDFDPKDEALCKSLVDMVAAHDCKFTAEAMASAWCMYKGVRDPLEPVVLKADDFHKKFTPITLHDLSFPTYSGSFNEVPELKFSQKLKTVAGAIKGTDMSAITDIAQQLAVLAAIEQQKLIEAKNEQEKWKKPVATMPTSWYSSDVVELNTERKIKDDD